MKLRMSIVTPVICHFAPDSALNLVCIVSGTHTLHYCCLFMLLSNPAPPSSPSSAPQHHPHPGGHYHSQGSELEQLLGGHDGQEDVG